MVRRIKFIKNNPLTHKFNIKCTNREFTWHLHICWLKPTCYRACLLLSKYVNTPLYYTTKPTPTKLLCRPFFPIDKQMSIGLFIYLLCYFCGCWCIHEMCNALVHIQYYSNWIRMMKDCYTYECIRFVYIYCTLCCLVVVIFSFNIHMNCGKHRYGLCVCPIRHT